MTVNGGMVVFLPLACATVQVDCSPAVVGSLTEADPALVLAFSDTGFGPGSAVRYTCPLGKRAAAASSAPNEAFGIVPPGPVRSACISGPGAQVFPEGVYRAVCWLAPMTSARPSRRRRIGPSSKPTSVSLKTGSVPRAVPSAGLILVQTPAEGLYSSANPVFVAML